MRRPRRPFRWRHSRFPCLGASYCRSGPGIAVTAAPAITGNVADRPHSCLHLYLDALAECSRHLVIDMKNKLPARHRLSRLAYGPQLGSSDVGNDMRARNSTSDEHLPRFADSFFHRRAQYEAFYRRLRLYSIALDFRVEPIRQVLPPWERSAQ